MLTTLELLLCFENANPLHDPFWLYFDFGLTAGFLALVFFKLIPYLFDRYRSDVNEANRQKIEQIAAHLQKQSQMLNTNLEENRRLVQEIDRKIGQIHVVLDRMQRMLEGRR